MRLADVSEGVLYGSGGLTTTLHDFSRMDDGT